MGAEKIIGAEKGTEKIAVEVKSFLGPSMLHDFYKAIGQFGFYYLALSEEEPDRTLYQDSTDYIVADMLLDKGIPKKDIVLGFHAPVMRADTEFSVG
ncbi:MAG: XisI protein [Lewinellaceae bacterium]|nr:XisI protein [Lewinellaceae bacterium]